MEDFSGGFSGGFQRRISAEDIFEVHPELNWFVPSSIFLRLSFWHFFCPIHLACWTGINPLFILASSQEELARFYMMQSWRIPRCFTGPVKMV